MFFFSLEAIKREGIKRRWSVSQKDWNMLWTECKNSIYSTYKPSDENKQDKQPPIEDGETPNDETDNSTDTTEPETDNENKQVFDANNTES